MIPLRLVAVPLAAVLAAGCGGDAPREGEAGGAPPAGAGASESAPEDLEGECAAAARKWKTLRAVYRAEGANPTTVTLAVERGGRVLLRADPGPAILLDRGWASFRSAGADGVARVSRAPVGLLYAAAEAIAAGRPIPARGEPPALPPDRVTVDLALHPGRSGAPERTMSLLFSLEEAAPFGWLRAVHVVEGVTIRAVERTAVVIGPAGRIAIDRDTGALVDWLLEPPEGQAARLTAAALEANRPLDEALFRLEGDPAPAAHARTMLLVWTLSFRDQAMARAEDPRRVGIEQFLRAYYRAAWTDADLDALAARGAARVKEAAQRLKEEHPDAPEDEIAAASAQAALTPMAEALDEAVTADIEALCGAYGARTPAARREVAELTARCAELEVLRPALERVRRK